jgi:hypothetical protein
MHAAHSCLTRVCGSLRDLRLEHRLKSFQQLSWESGNISSTDCVTYANRFLHFVDQVFK